MDFKRSYILVIAEISLLYFCTSLTAWGQQGQLTPELLQSATSTRRPSEPIRIRLSNLPPNAQQQLALELDEIDVTSMVTREGDVLVFTPAQPLAYGIHQVRLVKNSQDGSISELGEWSFELRKSVLFRNAQLNGSVTLNGSLRTSEHGLSEPMPSREQLDGAGQFAGSTQNENWRLSSALSIIANNQSQLMPRQKGHFDIGQFMIAADSGLYGLKAGDQQIGPDNFVLQSFNRRGISASANAPGDKASFTGFSMHTTSMTGAADILGVADSDNMVNGALATIKPIPGNLDALAIMGTYVDGGSNGQTGASVAGGLGSGSGRADSLVLDSSILQKRLRLRGEYATSNYDFDGSAGPLAPIEGHANTELVNYIPLQDLLVSSQPVVWNVGMERKLISTYFRSPSNPGGISDIDLSRAFTGLNWNGLNFQLNVGKQSDNVDDNPLIPTTAIRQRSGVVTYAPQLNNLPQPNGQPYVLPWYGQPSFNASYTSQNNEMVKLNGADYNQPTHAIYTRVAGASFQYTTWYWNIAQSWVSDQGFDLDLTPHTQTSATSLQGNFRFFQKLTVGLNLSSQSISNISSGIYTNGITDGLNLVCPFTDKINTNLTYTVQHNWATDGSSDTVTSVTSVIMNWIVDTPRGANPGVTFGMNGSYQDVRNVNALLGQNGSNLYQIFFKLSLSWSPVY